MTSPRLIVGGLPSTATTTSPLASVSLVTADSLGSGHYSLDTLLVRAVSSNAAVIQPDSLGFRIPRGAYFVYARVSFVGPGTASMTYSDSLNTGYASTTTNSVTVTGPSLTLYNGRPTLGMRQNGAGTSAYVTIPNAIGVPLVVNLVSTDPTVASVPASVTIATGQNYAYFQITAHDVIGTVQIQATATGYAATTVNQQVTAPRFIVSMTTSMNTTAPPTPVYVGAADAAGTQHYVNENVTVTLASPGAVGIIDSATVVIPAGGYYNNAARFRPVGTGTIQVSASDARGTSYSYATGTQNVSVTTPSLSINPATSTVGIGQWVEPYVSVPNNATSPLTVNVAHLNAVSTSAATVTIPTNLYYEYVRFTGASVGTDSLTFSATGHNSVVGAVIVGLGRVDALSGWPTTLSTDSVLVTLYARDQLGNIRNVAAATTFNLAVSGSAIELRRLGAPVTSVTIPADANTINFYVRRLAAGTATVTITSTNYTTQVTPTVTVP